MVLEAERREQAAAARSAAADSDAAGVAFDVDDWDDDSALYFDPERGNVIFAR